MKRIIRMEEVVDFFCGKRIEKLTYGEIRTAVGKMIMKQNRQASKDNMALGFKKYDLLIGLSDETVLEDWLGLKDYIKENLDGTEYLAVYRKKISGIYSRGEIEKQCYVSKSKYYELLSFVYSYAERYIYYHRLVRMGNENKREEPNGENTFSKQGTVIRQGNESAYAVCKKSVRGLFFRVLFKSGQTSKICNSGKTNRRCSV